MNIKIVDAKYYMPERKVLNSELEEKFGVEKGYIKRRTGIEERYYVGSETIEKMAAKAVRKISDISCLDMIVVATTSSNCLMPGISNYIQKELGIDSCICIDILAGCSGFINAFDTVNTYIQAGRIKKALVVGVDLLSEIVNKSDLGTVAVLSDGAGAVLVESTSEEKSYFVNIEAEKDEKDMLVYKVNEKLRMNGKEVYKYAVKNPIENVKKLIDLSDFNLDDIKYIIPHQSNMRIMKSIANRLRN